MTDLPRKPADDLARTQLIDRLCDEFEAAWLAGRDPQIQDYLARATEADRDTLARELLPLDQHHRRRRGESVEPAMTDALATEPAVSNSLRSVEQRIGPSSEPASSPSSAAMVSIGNCEVLQEIAPGGMGVVFKARETRTLRDHEDWISCLAFSPDGNTLATGSFDAKVRLWQATSEREITSEINEDRARADRWAAKRDEQRQARATRPHQMLSVDRLDRYVGTYVRKLIVQRQADHLLLHSLPGTQGQPVAFYLASETEFFGRDRPIDR